MSTPATFRVCCPCCRTTFTAQVRADQAGRHDAQLATSMDADFARLYLWARRLQLAHPADADVAMLVGLLRQADDIERRHQQDPGGTAANLAGELAGSIEGVAARVKARHPGERVVG